MPSKKRKRTRLYSVGELNRLVDDLFHPHYDQNESLRLLDALLHSLIEQNPAVSMRSLRVTTYQK